MPVSTTGIFLFYVLSGSTAIWHTLRRTLVRLVILCSNKNHFAVGNVAEKKKQRPKCPHRGTGGQKKVPRQRRRT